MPPRLSLQSAKSQLWTCLSRLAAPLSTTARVPARDMLLSLDGGSDGNHSGPGPANTAANESLVELMRNRQEHRQAARAGVRQRNLERLQQHQKTESYLKYMYRRWRPGDVYAPHDLSPGEMHKFRKMTRRHVDLLDVVNVNPVDEYRNFALLGEFITPMGRIKHSNLTALRPVNQRRVAKAIRRAIGLGLLPSVHKHPEILKTELRHLTKTSPRRGVFT